MTDDPITERVIETLRKARGAVWAELAAKVQELRAAGLSEKRIRAALLRYLEIEQRKALDAVADNDQRRMN